MSLLSIILGSRSDLAVYQEANAPQLLEQLRLAEGTDVSVVSAHRNRRELEAHCLRMLNDGVIVFCCIAGMSAALPGEVAAITNGQRLVIGVALPSRERPDARDATEAMIRMPAGTPVLCSGVGKSGIVNGILAAAQCIAYDSSTTAEALHDYRETTNPKPAFGINLPAEILK